MKNDFFSKMTEQVRTKSLLNQAQKYGYEYLDSIEERPIYPTNSALDNLKKFDEDLQEKGDDAEEILKFLHEFGAPATINQLGGRYYGMVNGGVIPIAMAAKWMSSVWDQNCALYHTSPINGCIEDVVQKWLVDLFALPKKNRCRLCCRFKYCDICIAGCCTVSII